MLRAALVAIAAMRAQASNNYTFVWYHPHKCGTSFALTLLRFDCPNLPDVAALETTASTAATQPRPSKLIGDFKAKYDCDARLNGEHTRVGRERRSRDGSEQLEWSWVQRKGLFVTILRDPRERILSHLALVTQHRLRRRRPPSSDLSKLAGEKSVYVRGLTADLAAADAGTAAARLEEGFQFVGILSSWAASVCLFHALFPGVACVDAEFANSRPGPAQRNRLAYLNDAGLNLSLDDPFWTADFPDLAVYAAAVRWFDARRRGDDECRTICPPRFFGS